MKETTLNIIEDLFNNYKELNIVRKEIFEAFNLLKGTFSNGNKLLCCGNGGSAADCDHIVGELMKGFCLPRIINNDLKNKINDNDLSDSLQYGLPAISLVAHSALFTAFCNDQNADNVFAQQVLGYGKENDLLMCLSTSGNSINCVNATKVAKALNMKIISLTGMKDSKLSEISDVCIRVPKIQTYQVQELHLPIYHALCLALENEFFGE